MKISSLKNYFHRAETLPTSIQLFAFIVVLFGAFIMFIPPMAIIQNITFNSGISSVSELVYSLFTILLSISLGLASIIFGTSLQRLAKWAYYIWMVVTIFILTQLLFALGSGIIFSWYDLFYFGVPTILFLQAFIHHRDKFKKDEYKKVSLSLFIGSFLFVVVSIAGFFWFSTSASGEPFTQKKLNSNTEEIETPEIVCENDECWTVDNQKPSNNKSTSKDEQYFENIFEFEEHYR